MKNAHETHEYPATLLIAVHAPYNMTTPIASYYEEFTQLAKTNGVEWEELMIIKLRDLDPATFFTKGKLDEIKAKIDELGIEEVIISEPLTPQQERNLNEYLGCAIFDRTHLILEIFEKAASSAAGKAQVEIAMLKHKKSRLAGKGLSLGQQKGNIGMRAGSGETLKEIETRHIEGQIKTIERQLEKLHKIRETQRKQRLESALPLICLVGYTNAGKSTILNALTKSDVLAEDKLFATLDTTTRELFLGSKKKALLSDTVGFIQMLPTRLIDAFKSTLDELHYANLLLHVVDLSDPNLQDHINVVNEILADIEIEKPILYVFNKSDKAVMTPALEQQLGKYNPHVIISSLTKEGIAPLVRALEQFIQNNVVRKT